MGRATAARAVLLAFALTLLVPLAGAHAVLLSSEPASGARLATPPDHASVTLTEPADPHGSDLQVLDSHGARVDNDDLQIQQGDNPRLTVTLKANLPDGAYTISWRALSAADGHATSGRVGFAVGAFEPPSSQASSVNHVDGLAASARGLAYAGIALAFGAAAFLWWIPASGVSHRAIAIRALALGAFLHTVGLALLFKATANATGLSLSALATSHVGRVLSFRLVCGVGALVLAGLGLHPRNPTRLGPALAVAFMLAAALGSSSLAHASTSGVAGIAVDAMHILASATWVGGLLILLVVLSRAGRDGLDEQEVRSIGLRFGTLALVCVIILFAAGTIASVLIVGLSELLHPIRFLGSAYGRFLEAKVALALCMVALAGANRFVFLGRGDGRAAALRARLSSLGPDGTRRGLRRVVALEASVGVVVLVLAGFLTAVSPPTTVTGPAPLSVAGDGDAFHYNLDLSPVPAVGGRSNLVLHVYDRTSGDEVMGNTCGRTSCVELSIGPAAGNDTEPGGERHVLVPDGHGAWTVQGVLWSFSGEAFCTIRVQTADVFQDNATLQFTVA
jgi:copper transport protein